MKPEFWPRVLVCADVVPVSCHVFGAWRTRYSVVGLLPPAQRALNGSYSNNPEEEFSNDKLQKHMNLLVRGATVDMEDMDCCESVVKKVEQITRSMEDDTYHSDSPYNSEDEEEEDGRPSHH